MSEPVAAEPSRSSRRSVSRLEIDTASLLGANAANLVLGLGFWAISARLYPTGVVGQATTIVATAVSFSSFANLGLGPVIERFLPLSGRRATSLVWRAHGLSALCSALVAIAVVVVDPVDGLLDGPGQRVMYVVLVVVLAAYSLQDSELIALGSSRLAALKNVVLSVTKLAAVAAGAVAGTTLMLVGAWLVPAALISVAVIWWIARGRTTMQPRMAAEAPTLPPRREIRSFWGITLAWLVAGSIPGFVVPLRVAQNLGLTSAAYFNAAWMIVAASTVFMSLATSPFVAAASRPDVDMRARTVEFVRFMAVVGVLRGVGLAIAGTAALYVYGPEYAEAGGPLLIVMGIVHVMSVPAYIYGALARVYRRIWYPMAVNALGSVVVVVLVSGWVDRYDLLGAGYAYLAQEVVTLALCLVPLTRLLRKGLAGVRPPTHEPTEEPTTCANGWWRANTGSRTAASFSLAPDAVSVEPVGAPPARLVLDDIAALDAIGDPVGDLSEVEILMSDGRVHSAGWPDHFCDAVVVALRARLAPTSTQPGPEGTDQPT